jgi:hypothetical protein
MKKTASQIADQVIEKVATPRLKLLQGGFKPRAPVVKKQPLSNVKELFEPDPGMVAHLEQASKRRAPEMAAMHQQYHQQFNSRLRKLMSDYTKRLQGLPPGSNPARSYIEGRMKATQEFLDKAKFKEGLHSA